ncbi:MAG: rRNA maturation RNase YbeY [Clostridiales bacterium GWB2_37_7]|nr:MAG: rRNA maturation RNase YbeY [Clostridiales bacterium GWB2_37_7]
MSVLIDNRQDKAVVDSKIESLVEQVVQKSLEVEVEDDYEVSISFVDNQEIRELNKQYRNKDSSTDVLSFPLMEFEETEENYNNEDEYVQEDRLLGDIVISLEKAQEQADEYGHSFERELAFLVVHGVLHLLGMDHENEQQEKEMLQKQDNILRLLNITR